MNINYPSMCTMGRFECIVPLWTAYDFLRPIVHRSTISPISKITTKKKEKGKLDILHVHLCMHLE